MTVIGVQGAAIAVDADGNETLLKNGDIIPQGTQVYTGKKSKLIVQFSSATTIVVNENSDVTFNHFYQVPYELPEGVKLSDLEKAPSISDALITVNDGTIAGSTAKLHKDSKLRITTPSGTDAVIGGTDYVVTVINRGGESFTTITNASGEVVAISQGNPVNIPIGQSVTIQATRTVSVTGVVSYNITSVGEPRDATGEEISTAEQAVTEIQLAEDNEDNPSPPEPTPGGPNDFGVTPTTDIDPEIIISPAA